MSAWIEFDSVGLTTPRFAEGAGDVDVCPSMSRRMARPCDGHSESLLPGWWYNIGTDRIR